MKTTKTTTLHSFFKQSNNLKNKESDKINSPSHIDPKNSNLQKKNETPSKQEEATPKAQRQKHSNKRSSSKDDVIDHHEDMQITQNYQAKENKNTSNSLRDKSRNQTQFNSNKKNDTEMEIEEQDKNCFGIKVSKKRSLLQQQKRQTPVKVYSEENKDEEQIEILEKPQVGLKKKKLTKLCDKKANIKPTKRQKAIMLENSNSEDSSESSESEEDSVKGDVEYIDDEVDNLQKNKKIDKMFQNKLEFKDKKQIQKPVLDQKAILSSFLPTQINSEMATQQLQKNLEQITINDSIGQEVLSDDDGYNSAEEQIRQIEEMQRQRLLEPKSEKQQVIFKDSPIKQNNNDFKNKELEADDDSVLTVDQSKSNIKEIIENSLQKNKQPQTFQDKKFYFYGEFTKYDVKQLIYIITENQGQVLGTPNQQFYNVIGDKNVNQERIKTMKQKNYQLYEESQIIQLIESTLQQNIQQIIQTYSDYKTIKQEQNTQMQEEIQQQQKYSQDSALAPKMIVSQKLETQSQKVGQDKQKKPEQQSTKSLLSSFLPTSSSSKGAKNEQSMTSSAIQEESSVEITSENSKNVYQSEVIAQKQNNFQTNEKIQNMVKSVPTKNDDKTYKKQVNEIEKNVQTKNQSQTKQIPQKSNKMETENYDESKQTLWTHKYAPKELKDCVGNETQIKKLENWLANWENVVIRKQKAQGNWKENPASRACLISGPPGIGKTSTVRLLAKKFNMNIIEWNASDVRNKSAIETIVNPLKDNQVLNFNSTSSSKRSIILMDEVDGMSSGDIGGNQSLIKIIKDTKNPIFCVCNDRYSQKLRSLTNHCFDVRFQKPTKQQVAKRLLEVCQNEGLQSDKMTLEALAEGVNTDIRQSLNLLQMYSKKSKQISYKYLVCGLANFQKDKQVQMSPFEAAKVLMTKTDFEYLRIEQKLDLFFLDYELVPLLVHENYLGGMIPQKPNNTSIQELEQIVDATSAMAESDLLGDCIRSGGNWTLLQNQGFLTSVYVPDKICNKSGTYPQMSQYLGKMSSQRKINRLIRELRMKLAVDISGNRQAVQFDYAEPLLGLIMNILENEGKDGVERVVDIMANYNISPEILKEHLIQLQYKSNIEERLKHVPTQVKTALTKAYNKRFKDDVKPEKKQKKSEDNEGQVKYDDILGEIDEVEIIEEEDEVQADEETSGDVQQSQNSTKQQTAKSQSTKNSKQSQKEAKQNVTKSLMTKGRK